VNKLLRRTLVGVALGALLYVVVILWFDARVLRASLDGYTFAAIGIALALSSLNYLLRFLKWELCLRWLSVRGTGPEDAHDLGFARSLQIYLAGLSMSVTPGKVGEVLRSALLKASDGVPFARTAPVVVADRATDLIALVILALVGIADRTEYIPHVVAALVLVLACVVLLGTPRVFGGILLALEKLPLVGRVAAKAHAMVESSAILLGLRPLAVLTAISVVGWGLECVGYYVVLHGFVGVEASLRLCTFLWATTTLVGALSFLPGGLGATEGSLAVLVVRMAGGMTDPIALASTLIIRACTLWYGEVVGALSLAFFMRDPRLAERARAAADVQEGEGASKVRAP
jgi:uncharacterized protein (TIRG00374 family)